MSEAQRIDVVIGDITTLTVDAVVNAANESLLGGGGVDGAIHRAAGPELREHNRGLGGCPTGLAKLTPAFGLGRHGVHHIIHTVGPVWAGNDGLPLGSNHEDLLLASCYMRCLELATEHACRSVAFPAISTGVYGFPVERAARIAIGHVQPYVRDHPTPHRVIFCCFSDADATLYRRLLGQCPAAVGLARFQA